MVRKQNFRGRRGQQAMEYMVTYGWAFVVIIVTIGAFAYFGLLNPEKYLPNRCDFGLQLKCVDYKLVDDGNNADTTYGFVYLSLQNAFGEDIRIIDVSTPDNMGDFCIEDPAEKCESDNAFSYLPIADGSANDGVPIKLKVKSSEYTLANGDKTLIPIIIKFSRNETDAPEHQLVGEVYATVQ